MMHLHILGICGTFMGGLAALAREAGHTVTGCDAGVYPPMSDQLRRLGIDLCEGFGIEQLELQPDVFVIGNVVSRARLPSGEAKFPLMEAILDKGLPYTSGPQWLCDHLLRDRHVMAVAGTHGKTTTTAMLAWILEQTGYEPGFLIGGVPLNFSVSARLGGDKKPPKAQGSCFVIEADEYDTAFFDKRSKFVHYRPRCAIINNLEFDHADIFDDIHAIERQFNHLLRTVPASGQVIYNQTMPSVQRVIDQGVWSQTTHFGAIQSDYQATGEDHDFWVVYQGKRVGRVTWGLSGRHNQHNALAAIAAAVSVGIAPEEAAQALGSFQSVKRRMEVRGIVNGVTVYDDFAHHPSAILTTLQGLRRQIGHQGRIFAIFEPRSNTMKLGTMASQLPDSLASADQVYCLSESVGWDPTQALMPLGNKAKVFKNLDDLCEKVIENVQTGDHLLCMSNGGFGGIHQKLLERLKNL